MTDVYTTISDSDYLQRALQLANSSTVVTSPNPAVGALLVAKNKIIGEGYTQEDGGDHAEVMAFKSVKQPDSYLLKEATLYVSLEPCSIFGRTPPCTNLIIKKKIKRVVIGCIDFTKGVLGKGLELLRKAGIEVVVGICQEEAFEFSKYRQAITRRNRPYIILKQAITADGYVGLPNQQLLITGKMANSLSHQWRGQVDAILVGVNTVEIDNPSLTARLIRGRSPSKVVLDPNGRANLTKKVFASASDHDLPTYWAVDEAYAKTCLSRVKAQNLLHVKVLPLANERRIPSLLESLLDHRIGRLLVEGGPTTISHFVSANAYDEYRKWRSPVYFGNDREAFPAAEVPVQQEVNFTLGRDQLTIGRNLNPLSLC